jgi:hypothetical protein
MQSCTGACDLPRGEWKTMATNPNQEVIDEIEKYRFKIKLMDSKVREFLANREKRPNPYYEGLVEEIQRFETRHHLSGNRDVQYHLERLTDHLYMYEQSWKKMFEREEELFRKKYEAEKKNKTRPA